MWFFTADEHYGHENILKYCNRDFRNIKQHDEVLIENFNKTVAPQDVTIHAGDFTLKDRAFANAIIYRLNGSHIFLKGSHDYWLPRGHRTRKEKRIDGIYIVVDHYPLRTWARSHFNSWNLHGHSHGKLPPQGKQYDVGVDNNGYSPISFWLLKKVMDGREDNYNYLRRGESEYMSEAR